MKIPKVLDIASYIDDGFKKLADVQDDWEYYDHRWMYEDINEILMYSNHTSWVYAIVDGDEIVKIGETGNVLGIEPIRESDQYEEVQPIINTKCRMGRLRGFGTTESDTDFRIRKELEDSVRDDKVSIWAKKCPIIIKEVNIIGTPKQIGSKIHKALEQDYLQTIKWNVGMYPRLNVTGK